ncbi:MAG TPA: glutamate-1-semialdehyde 2,1-aminomutase [Bacteroidota bacterium]|jgi:glutamate-1-semialdehyde 2,1-aminomutase|nr:glutamate-1-semialdehyde 2,1-aminomutase [Bacteroidota bacterium]
MKLSRSNKLFKKAKKVIPGGVNSPVRAFKSVDLTPVFIRKAKDAYIWDVDGNKYIDYIGSWGPMLLGHAHPRIIKAVKKAAKYGTSYGAATELEIEIAELICKIMPSIQMVRMVNSGTEATMSAIRLARAFTGRDKIMKFEGCYHGHGDSFLIKAGSGAATFGVPDSPGVTRGTAADTLNATYNDLTSVESFIQAYPDQIAAIIVEPVVGNMGCVLPKTGFLEGLRAVCTKNKIVLIFDEVMTGFRVAPGGAQEFFSIKPDLTTLGKIIGGGLPVGAYGGRRDLMEMVSPSGPMYQAGTLSGNPLAMAAGYAMLSFLKKRKSVYELLEQRGKQLEEGVRHSLQKLGLGYRINRMGSMFTLFFTEHQVVDWPSASTSDRSKFGKYFSSMLSHGIYLPPSQFEAAFISTAHTEKDIEATIRAISHSLQG